jgi:chromatin structure-remodeling complex protein RSC7
MLQYPAAMQPTHCVWTRLSSDDQPSDLSPEFFPPPTEAQLQDHIIVDTTFIAPPLTGPLDVPGPKITFDDQLGLMSTQSLSSVPEDVIALLPADCKAAFRAAQSVESEWMSRFGTEVEHGERASLRIGLEPKFLGV